jgi:serine/threonine protein kinase/predicted Zn-dependent protease
MREPNPPEHLSIWDRAEDDANRRRARLFERDWHKSRELGGSLARLEDYLPASPEDRPPALLALARVELACRLDAGEEARVEDYLHLDGASAESVDFVAGLAFEEYILRLEAGEKPRFSEFAGRFPAASRVLRELILIQEAVAGEALLEEAEAEAKRLDGFPDLGALIEGFELVGELGVGSYSRVYLARDKALAGRQVALKMTRGKQAEWLTLARLQHTHIVPIYSHSKTLFSTQEFDLLCMPYFGSVTLNTVIEHEDWGRCLDGQDILNLVDSLQPETLVEEARDSSARRGLAELNFPQAVAWWGACLADALHHAHERRILHRDIKPTNILVTPDCQPMLLDFNLAQPTAAGEAEPTGPTPGEEGIGGTLAYMAPEHLEAMITGQARLVDQRADIYALGAVLYQALTRCGVVKKSYVPAGNREELLRQNLELRRLAPSSVRDVAPDVPVVLDRVVCKCLDPDPSRRYASAADLCEDLRAIAADMPIVHASEPVASRLGRRLRRNRMVLASTAAVALFLIFGPGYSLFRNMEQARLARLTRDSQDDLQIANQARIREDYLGALNAQRRVVERLSGVSELKGQLEQSLREIQLTRLMEESSEAARDYFTALGWLRYRVLHATRFGGELNSDGLKSEVGTRILPLLDQFTELDHRRPGQSQNIGWLSYLNDQRRRQLKQWTDVVLFEVVCTLWRVDQSKSVEFGLMACQHASAISGASLPWSIMKDLLQADFEQRARPAINWPEPGQESSSVASLQMARLALLDGRPELAGQWLRRAVAISPADPWAHHELALMMHNQGQFRTSMDRIEIATALDPASPWARLDRARMARMGGSYSQAVEDLKLIRRQFGTYPAGRQVQPLLDLETGLVEIGMGRLEEARNWLSPLVQSEETEPSLRLVAAQALSEQMIAEGQWDSLQALINQFDPNHQSDSSWSLIRARLMLGQGRLEAGIAELTGFLSLNPNVTTARAMRTQAYLKSGRAWQAFEDARLMVRLSDTPLHRRLLDRCRMAVLSDMPTTDDRWFQTLISLRLDDPESIQLLPAFNRAQLLTVVERLGKLADDPRMDDARIGNLRNRCRLNLAVLESALGLSHWADTLERTVAGSDSSIAAIRAQVLVLIHENQLEEATERLEEGLLLSFEDPLLVDLRGRINLARGRYEAALKDFDNILATREMPEVRAWRAKTLERLARWNESLADLSKALSYDPFQPDWRMTRSRVWQRLGRVDLALADLELVTPVCADNQYLASRLALARTVLASSPVHSPDESSKILARVARSALPQLFVRPGIEELEFKSDLNLQRTRVDKK